MIDDDFRSRMKLLAQNRSIFESIYAVIDELIVSTYPCLNELQKMVLCNIIHIIWDIGFIIASYDELVLRLLYNEPQLFPTKEIVIRTIQELCDKRIIKSKMTSFVTYNSNGTLKGHKM
jgi:hypothetical protein